MGRKGETAMESKHNISWWNCVLKGYRWEVGIVGGLFLLGAVLVMFESKVVPEHANFANIILAHLLAIWSYILGLVGLAAISLRMLVRARTRCQ
jgi:hypothetical protein